MSSDPCFKNCGTGIEAFGHLIYTTTGTTIHLEDTTRFVSLRGQAMRDFAKNVRITGVVGHYVLMQPASRYQKINAKLRAAVGSAQPTRVFETNGNCQISLVDTAGASLEGSTAFVRLSGVDVTHADYITKEPLEGERFDTVEG